MKVSRSSFAISLLAAALLSAGSVCYATSTTEHGSADATHQADAHPAAETSAPSALSDVLNGRTGETAATEGAPAEAGHGAAQTTTHGATDPHAAGDAHGGHEAHDEHSGGHGITGDLYKGFNFLLVVLILGYFLNRPISAFLANRTHTIASDLSEAKEARAKAEADLQACLATLSQVRAELDQAKAEGRAIAEKERDEMLAHAKVEVTKLEENARRRLAQESVAAQQELKDYVVRLAKEQARAALTKRLTPELQEKLVLSVDLAGADKERGA